MCPCFLDGSPRCDDQHIPKHKSACIRISTAHLFEQHGPFEAAASQRYDLSFVRIPTDHFDNVQEKHHQVPSSQVTRSYDAGFPSTT